MTLQEFCKKFNYSESTVKKMYQRTVKNMEDKGWILTKIGRGENAEYYVKPKED